MFNEEEHKAMLAAYARRGGLNYCSDTGTIPGAMIPSRPSNEAMIVAARGGQETAEAATHTS